MGPLILPYYNCIEARGRHKFATSQRGHHAESFKSSIQAGDVAATVPSAPALCGLVVCCLPYLLCKDLHLRFCSQQQWQRDVGRGL